MGYGSVILVLSGILLAGVLLLSMESAVGDADEELNDYHHHELARDAATTGLHLTVRKLAASADGGSWKDGSTFSIPKTAFHSGSFLTEVISHDPINMDFGASSSGDTVDVTARGFNGPGRAVIFARYAREYADGGVPPAFRNVITTDIYIQLQGNVNIRSIRPDLNASIHTNGDLITNGNSFLVEGYGTYTGNEYTNQEDNFVPNIDRNGPASNVFWAPLVDIPLIDMDGLRTLSQTSGARIDDPDDLPISIDGDALPTPNVIDFRDPTTWPFRDEEGDPLYLAEDCKVYDGCGTETNPFIMVVEEPLNFFHRVRFEGYGVIVSPKNVFIDPLGNGGGVFGALNENKETQVMLATLGNIDIAGNACMGLGPSDGNTHCQSADDTFTHGMTLYAQATIAPFVGVTFRGTPYLVGGIVAPETRFDGGGTPQVYYAAPGEVITDPGFEFIIPIGPILIAYSEW